MKILPHGILAIFLNQLRFIAAGVTFSGFPALVDQGKISCDENAG